MPWPTGRGPVDPRAWNRHGTSSVGLLVLALLSLLLAADGGVSLADYEASRVRLESERARVATVWKKDKPGARREARTALLAHLEGAAFPAWSGTPWEFYGTTTTPRQGTIACGYLVSTVLEQAHLKVERVRLAQQASAHIATTLARGSPVARFTHLSNAAAVEAIRERFGDGLFVVGFDYHVGFLRLDGARAEFCHAAYLAPAVATCEDPVAAAAFSSSLHVVANVLNDGLLDDWLHGREIATVTPPARSRRR